jgi:dCTP deaminase
VILSDRDLKGEIAAGSLSLDPYDPDLVQPASVDIRLGRLFRVFNSHQHTHIDPAVRLDGLTTLIRVGHEGFLLHPGEFALGTTIERIRLGGQLAARLEGKSSLGRLGLVVHSTAGFIDPGFDGHVTLELSNVNTLPLRLWVGMKVGQLCVLRVSSPVDRLYGTDGLGSRYQGQEGPTESRSWKDFPPA